MQNGEKWRVFNDSRDSWPEGGMIFRGLKDRGGAPRSFMARPVQISRLAISVSLANPSNVMHRPSTLKRLGLKSNAQAMGEDFLFVSETGPGLKTIAWFSPTQSRAAAAKARRQSV